MTFLSSPHPCPRPSGPCGGLDRPALAAGAEHRRARLRWIEDAIELACEAAALEHAPCRLTRDRCTWDRRAWGRYVTDAVDQAGRHGTEIARLRRDAVRLDRLVGDVS